MSRPKSKVPVSWGEPPNFAFANREEMKEYACSDALPRWLRATFAAYAHCRGNGHANFRPGELGLILGELYDEITPAPRQRIYEAINGAIDRGLLMPESKLRCLVVPPSLVAYGKGAVTDCRHHKRNEETVSSEAKTTRFLQVISDQKERQNRVVSRMARSALSTKNATVSGTEAAS